MPMTKTPAGVIEEEIQQTQKEIQDIKVGILDRLTVEIGVAEKEVEGATKKRKESGNYPFGKVYRGKNTH